MVQAVQKFPALQPETKQLPLLYNIGPAVGLQE